MSAVINIEKLKKDRLSDDIIAKLFYHIVFSEKISNEDLELFKWYGVYAKDSLQEAFSLRIPINLGELGLKELKEILKISKEFSNESLNILPCQKIEFEDIKLFNLPKIFNILKEVKLSSFFESSHSIKRVLTCPANRVDSTQIYDVEEIANKINVTFVANKNFFNLPNSLQISISGYEEGCDIGFTPDISFNATKDESGKIVFAVKILDINIGYINASKIIHTTRAIANIYKDFGPRDEKSENSFKDFIDSISLSVFVDILSSMLDFKFKSTLFINRSEIPRKPRMGINKSSQDGFSYVGCKVKNSKISSKNFEIFINSLEKSEATKIKLTHKANIIILDVPSKNAQNLIEELSSIGFEAKS